VLLKRTGQRVGGRFNPLLYSPEVARGPIQASEALENCAFDAMLRVTGERHLLFGTIFCDRIKQADDTGVDEIIAFDMDGQVLMDANCNGLHKLHMCRD
jgi:hypothetical protein